jgi:hypothetical protein
VTVLRRRDRVVYFRVSEQEYERYRQCCQLAGARSVSDLVRAAMDHYLENGSAGLAVVTQKLERIEQVVAELNGRVNELSEKARARTESDSARAERRER